MNVFANSDEMANVDQSPQRTRGPAFALLGIRRGDGRRVLGSDRECLAQAAGPYGNDAGGYAGPLSYNPTYSQYGLPGVGVSPWNPIVQQQLNLGMRTARYQMYSGWANQSNAAANLFYQQAIAQEHRNGQQTLAVPPRYDVRQRIPRPVDSANDRPKMLPKNAVLRGDGAVLWPATLPADDKLEPAKAAAEAAIRVAVKEYEASGNATVQSVAEAKSQLFAFGKPARSRRCPGIIEQPVENCSTSSRAWNTRSTSLPASDMEDSRAKTNDHRRPALPRVIFP